MGVPAGIVAGMEWAADLGVLDGPEIVKRFDSDIAFPWLDSMLMYRSTCLFIPVPDVYGDAKGTIEAYWRWFQHFTGWPLAFVAQDGQENLDFPDEWQALFIGGTTEWKESPAAIEVIKRGQALGKHIHVGRVNWWRRYALFRQIKGSEEFTCDGTRQRFEGIERTKAAWAEYQRRLALPLF